MEAIQMPLPDKRTCPPAPTNHPTERTLAKCAGKMEFKFEPADVCLFHHKLLGLHLSLNTPITKTRDSTAANVAKAAMHRVITQAQQHIRTTTMLRQPSAGAQPQVPNIDYK